MKYKNIQHPDITESWRTGEMWRPIRSPIVKCSICECEMVARGFVLEPVCETCQEVIDRYEGEEPA